nr:hypothetical protein [Tanacetum cinerariifolium]
MIQESAKSDKEESADYEHEKEELRMWLTVVSDKEETVDLKILATKYPIVDWESHNLGNVYMEDLHVYKIIRANGNISYHKSLSSMLRKFDRQDLVDFYRLVMKTLKDNTPEGYNLLLWGDLKKPSKKQKMIQESAKSDKEESVDYEHEKEELRMWLTVVSDKEETVDPKILATKYPIVDWESHNLGNVYMEDLHVYKIIRANRNISYHKSLSSMLRKFNRQDLVDFYRLVMKTLKDNTPEGYNLLLWGDLKVVSWRRIKAVAVGGGGQRRMRSEEDDDDGGNWDDGGL